MPFAARADLLARSNASRLFRLAVPADMPMPADDEALRIAIEGGDLSGYDAETQAALAAALDAIDHALNDADALILSYGIPATVQTTLLARLAATVAFWFLQGAERMTKEVQAAYDAAVNMLKAHSRGEMNLVPAAPGGPAPVEDAAIIESAPPRYGRRTFNGDW